MSSTPPARQEDAPNTGEPPHLDAEQTPATAAVTATGPEPTPDIPPRSPHRLIAESQPTRTEDGTMGPGLGGSTGQSLNLPPNNTDATLQAHGTETANLGDSDRRTGGEVDRPIEEAPPPAYSEYYGKVDISQDGFDTQARVANDGRVDININQKSRRLSNLLVPALRSQLNVQLEEEQPPPGYIPRSLGGQPGQEPPPPLNVVIHVVGSRGDVQPFVSLGQVLKMSYGHRVRLATHPTFKQLVVENGLEFFSIGGDPAELMAFMVKNPGLMPGMDSLRSGDVGKRRKGMYEIVQGCWRSCIEAGDGTGIEASDDQADSISFDSGISVNSNSADKPFVADAIIANPPSFAHIHIAEKMGIPLHLMFTMPWSPTQAFPHPLANIESSNADISLTNFVSYALVEMMTWQGLGDIINRFREKSLGLEAISLMWAPGMASRLKIPFTYCWSPALIPKPKDWGRHIDIAGFYFLSAGASYTPPPELAAFLAAGPPPIYIGFGSIVVDDPNAMTRLIFDTVKKTGQRALVSKGWGGFGADELGIPMGVFMLGNVPHDWLFRHVSCVVHHGGAGTTAAGIACGKPTVVVPFFGDQPFWGSMVAKAGAGPQPIPYKHLTADGLAKAILEALKPTALRKAQDLGAKISSEKGADIGAVSFHRCLAMDDLRCALTPSRVAVWRVKRTSIRLSAFAATVLINEGLLDLNSLKLYRPREYDSEDGPWDPISGATAALLGTFGSMMMGFADMPVEVLRALKIKPSERSAGPESAEHPVHADRATIVDLMPQSTNSSSEGSSLMDDRSGSMRDGGGTTSPITASTDTVNDLSSLDERASTPNPTAANSQNSTGRPPSEEYARQDSAKHFRSPSKTQAALAACNQHSVEAALGAGKGVGRIVSAGLKSPMDFTLGIARGFHNAPKLYGDDTVRQADKITDFQSGLKAAGKGFGLGMYDGIAGFVTQPIDGAKKEGVAGLIKGFGKGIGGLMLKPSAAIWALPGYTFKGIYKEIQSHMGSSVHNYVIASRTAQGFEEWKSSSDEERLDVVSRWHSVQLKLKSDKSKPGKDLGASPREYIRRHMSSENRNKHAKDKKPKVGKHGLNGAPQWFSRSQSGLHDAHTGRGQNETTQEQPEMEEAIQRSVTATSRGNPEEDRLIERAIRASVAELQRASQEGDDDEALNRAIQASVTEAAEARRSSTSTGSGRGTEEAGDHDEVLEAALHRSVQDHHRHGDGSDSGIDTDDDEAVREAIELSKESTSSDTRSAGNTLEEEAELQRVMEESKKAQNLREEDDARAKTEEEIVLEYVKKQSLAEQEHRSRHETKGKSRVGTDNGSGDDDNDDDMKRALEESLKLNGKIGESSTGPA